MTKTTKLATPKNKRVTPVDNRQKTTKDTTLRFDRANWVVYAVGVLVITCLCIFAINIFALGSIAIPSPFYAIFWFPPLPMLLIALFGSGYIYQVLRGKPIGKLSRMVLYMLLTICAAFLLFAATIPGGEGHMCEGFFGVQTDCSGVNAFYVYLYFGNPFSLMLLSALAITGGMGLLRDSKK